MFCQRCGKEAQPGAFYCGRCGASLENVQNSASSGKTNYAQPVQSNSGPAQGYPYNRGASGTAIKSKKKKIILISVIAAVAIIGIVCAVLEPILVNKKSSDQNSFVRNTYTKQLEGTWVADTGSNEKWDFFSDGKVACYNGSKTIAMTYRVDENSKMLSLYRQENQNSKINFTWDPELKKTIESGRGKRYASDGKAITAASWYVDGNKLYLAGDSFTRK